MGRVQALRALSNTCGGSSERGGPAFLPVLYKGAAQEMASFLASQTTSSKGHCAAPIPAFVQPEYGSSERGGPAFLPVLYKGAAQDMTKQEAG
ncbi:hypothetical protein ES703_98667 [subsurface metagenome]